MFSRLRPLPTPTSCRWPTSSQQQSSSSRPQTGWQASTKERRGPRPAPPRRRPPLPTTRRRFARSAFRKKAGDLAGAGADPAQQVLDPRGGGGDPERLLDPGPHRVGVMEAPLGDLRLEPLHLGGAEPTGTAPIVPGAECVQSLVAEDPQPLADLACRDPRQFGDLFTGPSGVAPEDGRQPLVHPTVLGLPS